MEIELCSDLVNDTPRPNVRLILILYCLQDCLVLVATLALTVSCQDQRLEIVPLFEGLTSTPGNQFTFQPQPAVPGLERETELTSPSPSLNLQAFKAVPIGE